MRWIRRAERLDAIVRCHFALANVVKRVVLWANCETRLEGHKSYGVLLLPEGARGVAFRVGVEFSKARDNGFDGGCGEFELLHEARE